jgi:hypothetical protein
VQHSRETNRVHQFIVCCWKHIQRDNVLLTTRASAAGSRCRHGMLLLRHRRHLAAYTLSNPGLQPTPASQLSVPAIPPTLLLLTYLGQQSHTVAATVLAAT